MKQVVVLFFLSLALPLLPANAENTSCKSMENELTGLLRDSSCAKDSDCAAMELPPPFGCNSIVNKSQVKRIEQKYATYDRQCGPFSYNCYLHSGSISCEEGKCRGHVRFDRRYASTDTLDEQGQPFRK